MGFLNDISFRGLSGGTPRKDKSYRRSNRTKVWNIVDICTWIGRKVINYLFFFYATH